MAHILSESTLSLSESCWPDAGLSPQPACLAGHVEPLGYDWHSPHRRRVDRLEKLLASAGAWITSKECLSGS